MHEEVCLVHEMMQYFGSRGEEMLKRAISDFQRRRDRWTSVKNLCRRFPHSTWRLALCWQIDFEQQPSTAVTDLKG